jgi:hypothetical protein
MTALKVQGRRRIEESGTWHHKAALVVTEATRRLALS